MYKWLSILVAGSLISVSAVSYAQLSLSHDSSIKVSGVQIGCSSDGFPVVTAKLLINVADRGLPGVIYIAAHNDAQTDALFNQGGSWTEWQGGFFPIAAIMGNGLQDTSVSFQLPRNSTVRSTVPGVAPYANIFIGYGVLTNDKEAIVQKVAEANAAARAASPNKNLPVVSRDHHRQAFVQEDLTKNVKYQMIASSSNLPTCMAQNFSGG